MPSAAETSLAAAFAPPPREPGWLSAARLAALGRFQALGLPTIRDEDWRFTSLAALGAETDMRKVDLALRAAFEDVFDLEPISASDPTRSP